MGWRKVTEAVIQKTPIVLANKAFKPTSNKRNEAMFKEATEFAQSIRVLEKDMKVLLKNMDGHFRNLRNILVSPLPRIFDDGPMGVHPLDEEPRLLGANMEVEGIPRAAEIARQRIKEEVLDPLHDWLNIYTQIQERMRILEALRLELDSRRRTVGNLQGKLERVRSGHHKNRDEMERETIDTMDRKREKMETNGQKFMEMEQLVYNSLYTLVRDTAVLRDYTHCCLTIIKEAFESAAKAYDTPPTAQLSTNNANGGYNQPENKYEAQLTGTDRGTPKGIGGLFDRLRGKPGANGKIPASPSSMKDAQDHDQMPYGGYPPAYSNTAQRVNSGYMRPSSEADAPQQPGYAAQQTGYAPNTMAVPTYGSQAGNYQTGTYAAPQKYPPPTAPVYGNRNLATMPSVKYGSQHENVVPDYSSQHSGRYTPQTTGGGWTREGL